MSELPNVTPGEIIASAHINDIKDRSIQRYIDMTDLNNLNPTPEAGDLAFLSGVNPPEVWIFTGGLWKQFAVFNENGAIFVDGEVRVTNPSGQATQLNFGDTGGNYLTNDKNQQTHLRESDAGVLTSFGQFAVPLAFIESDVIRFGVDGANGTFTVHKANQTATAEKYLQVHNITTTGSAANTYLQTIPGELHRLQLSTSARRYKSNIQPADQLASVTLEPVTFHHDGDGKDYIGFIADDIAAQLPDAGVYNDDGEIENYDTRAVVAALAAKVNELTARLEALEG